MKISDKKNRMKNWGRKSLLYVVICYLLASWGVNGVINPMHYYRQFVMEEKAIDYISENKNIILEWNEDREEYRYISFEVLDAKNLYNDIWVDIYSDDELLRRESIELHKGLNSLAIEDESVYVSVSSDEITKNQLIIKEFVLSMYRKVDTWNMVEIFISMIFLLTIWECIQLIKNRYAK